MAIKKKQKVRRRGARREAKNKSHGAHKNHWAERKTITKTKAAISHKKRGKGGSETSTRTRKKRDTIDVKQKQEFICSACGYEAYKMAGYSHCPLCIICRGCQKTVRRCSCREKE